MTDAAPLSPFQWQLKRQRPGFRQEFPVSGLGPTGGYTLWSVNPAGGTKLVIRNGRPTTIELADALSEPAIRRLRDAIIASLDADHVEERVSVSVKVYEYAAAVLRLNYDLSDDDLTFLLTNSTRWIKDIIHHACGGTDIIEQMCSLSPRMLTKFLEEPTPAAPLVAKPLPARPSLWRRILAKLGR
jgi:hypothetical protein